jgi:hypothetical protein
MKPYARVELELRHLPRFRVMDYLSQVGVKQTACSKSKDMAGPPI